MDGVHCIDSMYRFCNDAKRGNTHLLNRKIICWKERLLECIANPVKLHRAVGMVKCGEEFDGIGRGELLEGSDWNGDGKA